MFVRCFGLGLAVCLLLCAAQAQAIVIDTGKGRVGGFLLSDDGTKLRISVPTPGGEEKISEYLHADVTIVHQLDVKRLEALSRDNPKAYRDYADQLARQEGDPEARYTAMRLYLIAAWLAPNELGPGSLLRLSDLATRPAEARRCRAMAYLLGPRADATLLARGLGRPAGRDKVEAQAVEDFAKALQLFRTGQVKAASDLARRDGLEKVFAMAPGNIDRTKFLQWCDDAHCTTCRQDGTVACPACNGKGTVLNDFGQPVRCPTCKGKKRTTCPDCGGTHVRATVPGPVLRVVLRCELWAIEQQGGPDNAGRKEAPDRGWSAIVGAGRLGPVAPLSLETITSFDPRKCLYRNRKWVEE